MKKLPVAVLNGIVAAICALAIIGHFFFPIWSFKVKFTFNQEVASFLLENMDAGEESGESNPDLQSSDEDADETADMMSIIFEELAKENFSIELKTDIKMSTLMSCALSSDTKKAEEFVLDLVDDLLALLDADYLKEIEQKIAKVGVSSAVKISISEIAKEQGISTEELQTKLNEAGLDDEFIDEQTTKLIDELYSDDSTVDSVTDTVMEIVTDSFDKIQASGVLGEDVEDLTDEDLEMIEETIAEVLGELADENGNLDGDGILSALLSGLLSGEGEGSYDEGNPDENLGDEHIPEYSSISLGIAHSIHKFSAPSAQSESIDSSSQSESTDSSVQSESTNSSVQSESTDSNGEEAKPIDEMLRDMLLEAITEEVLVVVRYVAIGLLGLVAFAAFWWIFLLFKMLCKLGMKNKLIKLKSAIILGGFAYVILAIIPNTVISLLANPPAFLVDTLQMEQEVVDMLKMLFGSAIKIKFSSSTLIPFICAIVLFVFGFFYSARRRAIKREIKRQRREARRLRCEARRLGHAGITPDGYVTDTFANGQTSYGEDNQYAEDSYGENNQGAEYYGDEENQYAEEGEYSDEQEDYE